MIEFETLNIPAFVRHYMLANTPGYLYRHLRAEPSVKSLAEASTPKELLAAVTSLEVRPERRPEDVAIAYAMLVALSFQNYGAVREALTNWQPKTLTWARHILSIITQTAIVTTTIPLHVPRGRVMADPEKNDTPSTILEMP